MGPRLTLQELLASDVDRAFPRLVDEHAARLYAVALSHCRHPADAEDIVAEALFKAYRALRSYDEDRIHGLDVAPWLVTIVLNGWRNEARRRRRRPVVPLLAEHDAAAEDEDLLVGVLDQQLLAALHELDEDQRTAVVLRHVAGLSYRQMAEMVDRPVGTLKSHVSRGLQRLRHRLSNEERE